MSELSELFTDMEEKLLDFVVEADSSRAAGVRAALHVLEIKLKERPDLIVNRCMLMA
jgi:hypothetical protein